jgi:mediator of RNA polymerase II transcription subunit 12
MEGHKNPAPFAWSWFGTVRIERRPSRYEQEFRKLLHHAHPRRKPNSYFINPPPDDDVEDDDDDKMENDDKTSQPSTPQTPAETKGSCKDNLFVIFCLLCC